ncbi:MAG TPA: ribbon-helix-helix protein, CopG family [Thermoanaerobaculia bacterium]|nr:ribbon-helix-helix protein, CopG family [Thermoanaerobaculia bacterium]
MAEHLQPTQILLEPEQHEKLARIASREHRTISELVREILQEELERREEDAERQSQRLEQLEQLKRHREEMLARRGGKPLNVNVAELLNEMRDERDDEILANIFPPRP